MIRLGIGSAALAILLCPHGQMEADVSRPTADWTLADSKIMAPEEFRAILAECKKLGEFDPLWVTMYDAIAIGINTGLRISEVLHIAKEDVLPSRLMVIRRKKKVLHPEPVEVKPEVHVLLRSIADRVDMGWIFPGRQAPCFIKHFGKRGEELGTEQFCIGGHLSLRCVQRRWRVLLESMGLYKHGRGFHTTRHGAITAIYQKTKDIRKAQVFAGHSSSTITERYAHVTDMRETLAGMEAVL